MAALRWFGLPPMVLPVLLIVVLGIGAVVVGRFSGPVRAGVPLVAGALRMPAISFSAASFLGALASSLVFLVPAAVGAGTLFDLFGLG